MQQQQKFCSHLKASQQIFFCLMADCKLIQCENCRNNHHQDHELYNQVEIAEKIQCYLLYFSQLQEIYQTMKNQLQQIIEQIDTTMKNSCEKNLDFINTTLNKLKMRKYKQIEYDKLSSIFFDELYKKNYEDELRKTQIQIIQNLKAFINNNQPKKERLASVNQKIKIPVEFEYCFLENIKSFKSQKLNELLTMIKTNSNKNFFEIKLIKQQNSEIIVLGKNQQEMNMTLEEAQIEDNSILLLKEIKGFVPQKIIINNIEIQDKKPLDLNKELEIILSELKNEFKLNENDDIFFDENQQIQITTEDRQMKFGQFLQQKNLFEISIIVKAKPIQIQQEILIQRQMSNIPTKKVKSSKALIEIQIRINDKAITVISIPQDFNFKMILEWLDQKYQYQPKNECTYFVQNKYLAKFQIYPYRFEETLLQLGLENQGQILINGGPNIKEEFIIKEFKSLPVKNN